MKGPNEGGSGSSGGFGWTGRSGNGRGRLGEGGWRWSQFGVARLKAEERLKEGRTSEGWERPGEG